MNLLGFGYPMVEAAVNSRTVNSTRKSARNLGGRVQPAVNDMGRRVFFPDNEKSMPRA